MSLTPENSSPRPGPTVPEAGPHLRITSTSTAQPITCDTAEPVTLIGTRRDCHLPLNDPEVSKIHCAVVHTGGTLLVCDLCSRSGTFVNGQPVRVGVLKPGDRLRIGAVELLAEAAGPQGDVAAEARPLALTVGGRKLVAPAGAALIGRRSTCDIILDTPDISLAHALLFTFDDRPVICDLGSRSGTILNDERIHLAWVQDGDRLSIGGETLAIGCEEPIVAAAAQPQPVQTAASADVAASPEAVAATAAAPSIPEAVLAELAEQRCAIEARAAELARREAELDALAASLAQQLDSTAQLKAQLAQRAVEIERTAEETRARLALAIKHEQALTSAWQELERWHSTLEIRYKTLRSQITSDLPTPPPDAGLRNLRNAAPVAQLFAGADSLARPGAGPNLPNA